MTRRVAIVVAVLVLLLAVPVSFAVKAVFFPPTFNVTSIATTSTYQDAVLLREAWELPVARTYKQRVDYQANGSLCGPTSIANVMRSLRAQPSTAAGVIAGTDKCQTFGICMGGLTLDDLAALLRDRGKRKVTLLRGLSLSQFRSELHETNNIARRYIINFQRGLLFGKGTGHHSPIGGYLQDRDLVFVLDVNEKFKPWLVTSERLYRAMDSVDSSSGTKRGLLRVE